MRYQMLKRIVLVTVLSMIPSIVFAGTGYIPIWQHGSDVTYFNIMINTDTKAIMCELTLIDVLTPGTYTPNQMLAPGEAWIYDTATGGPWPHPVLFGWGYMTSTGDPGATYGWGAIYGTVSGKIAGLTVLSPESGF